MNIPENQDFDVDTGYLLYINIKRDMGDVSGVNIGIDYNYKLFIIFTGKNEQKAEIFKGWMFYLMIPFNIISISMVVYIRKKNKKPIVKPKITDALPVIPKKEFKEKKKEVIDIRQKIDDILERDHLDKFRGDK